MVMVVLDGIQLKEKNKKEADEAQQMIMMEQVMYMVIIDASEVGNGVGEVVC